MIGSLGRVLTVAALLLALAAPAPGAAAGLFGSAGARPKTARESAKDRASTEAAAAQLAQQVRQALEERRFVDAGAAIDQAEALKISSPELIELRGYVLLARGRFNEALEVFRAIPPANVNGEVLQGLGLTLSQLGRTDDALAPLQAATEKDKTLWRAWNALGREYDLRHDWGKAQSAYATALAAPGANAAIVLNNRGYSHLLQRQYELASADFVAALAKDPALAAARTNLRLTLAMQGAYGRATATGVGDDRAAVLNNVGLAAAMRGDYVQADKLLSQAIAAKGQYYGRAAENLQLSHDLAARAEEAPSTLDAHH